MDTMTCTQFVFVLTVCTYSMYPSVTGTVRIVCTNKDTASIPLTCSSNQMIHVISELYGRRTEENCRVARDDSAKLFESDSKGLIVNCNGHAACSEHTACGGNCNNGTGHAFEVIYTCVENSKNICNPLHQTSLLSLLYLHSPRFPNSAGVWEEGDTCECTVSGQSLEVFMIDHRGRQDDLQITTTGADNNTWTSTAIHFNRKIASNVRSVLLTYTNHPDRKFWVRISGNITSASCGISLTSTTMTKLTDTTTTVPSTTNTRSSSSDHTGMTTSFLIPTDTETGTDFSTSYTTDKYVPSTTATVVRSTDFVSTSCTGESSLTREEENTAVMTVSAVCGVIIFLLLVIIGLLVYFKVIKPQRQNNTDNRVINNEPDFENANGSNEARNTYSDLVRYENQDNDYGKLHLYANPDFESEESKKGKRK